MTVEADDAATKELLGRLTEGVRSVAVRDPETGAAAVLVPADRYVQLVGKTLRHSSEWNADLQGRSFPVGLAEADVEQVDPEVSWHPVEHRIW